MVDSLYWTKFKNREIITKRLTEKNYKVALNSDILSVKPIDCIFMKRSSAEMTIPTGNKYSWKITNSNNSVRFVFVAFKNVAAPSPQTNNALFTQNDGTPGNKITSLRLQLNSMYYPIDRIQIDFENYKIAEPFISYVNVWKTFGNEPQLSVQEAYLSPIFRFDVSAQPESLKTHGVDITLIIEKTTALTLQAYVLILEDAYFQINCNDGKMLRFS